MHFARRLSYRYLDLTGIFSPFSSESAASHSSLLKEIDQNIADPTDPDPKPYILISISIYILILLRLTVQLMATLS